MGPTHQSPIWALVPFVLLLGAIAVLPLLAGPFWEKNRNKLLVALALSLPTAVYLVAAGFGAELLHSLVFDYIPFIVLLAALFVITGGIFVEGNFDAEPSVNTATLGIGAVLASIMGTTGAALLLIRPLLRSMRPRHFKTHTVLFFVAIVCNCGGLLTPLGDPPLFMMYLRGVPFGWFLTLFPEWLAANGTLLLAYYLLDRHLWQRESEEVRLREQRQRTPIVVQGKRNLLWLTGVVLAVALINSNVFPVLHARPALQFVREGFVALMAVLSLRYTRRGIHRKNAFAWHPIEEVAYLFLGVFVTMVPCVLYLEQNAHALGTVGATTLYFATGSLSAVLDNTPTAVTLYSLAQGLGHQAPSMVAGIPVHYMEAISAGSVFFGAMTYIGNGPNFMVKAVAEHQGIAMPHFFAYVGKFALPVLLPVFFLIGLLFYR